MGVRGRGIRAKAPYARKGIVLPRSGAVSYTHLDVYKRQVNGVEVKTTKDKPVKVTVKTAAAGSTVKVTAELKPGGDYTFTGGNANGFDTGNNYSFAGNAVATLTAPTRSAGADTVALTGNDGATYTIAGTTLAVPTGLVKTVVVPGSTGQQIVVVAKPKAGYSLTNAAADLSLIHI